MRTRKVCLHQERHAGYKALAMSYTQLYPYFLTQNHLQAYTRLAELCRNNPGIKVKYVFRTFSDFSRYHVGSASRGLMHQGIVLLKALRKIDVATLDLSKEPELVCLGERPRRSRKVEDWYADNLRFFADPSPFDEEKFRANAGCGGLAGVKGGVDRWVEVEKDWKENGF
jgi:hypothetical protein